MNASETLTPERASALTALWTEAFADLSDAILEHAFRKTINECKFWPKIADIRAHIEHTHTNATEEEAGLKFDRVLDYAVRRSPDIREKNPPRISEHTRRAINAAGGLDYLRDCDRESLQWARKRFIEAYVRYGELQQDEYLLPDGEVKALLADAAQTRALPGPDDWNDLHARGIAYSEELKQDPSQQPDIKRAIRAVAGKLEPRPPMRPLEEQKRILRERGFLRESQPVEVSAP